MPLPKKQIYTSEDYWNLPEERRAELIDGQIYDMAPPDFIHQKILSELHYAILNHVKSKKRNCEVIPAPLAVNLNADDKIWVEPDISVICDKNKISHRGCKGAPDWIIEIISQSTQRIDYSVKLFKYRTAGVREYWIVNPITKTVQTYSFEGEEDACQFSFDNEISSHIFDGLTIRISDLV